MAVDQKPVAAQETRPRKKVPFGVSFVAGGVSGTVGAVLTCPLEVVKTRLQSTMYHQPGPAVLAQGSTAVLTQRSLLRSIGFHIRGTVDVLRAIHQTEGLRALWKGVGATVVGVMPSRAIYFSTYAQTKHLLVDMHPSRHEGPLVHLSSAAVAGIATATATNPIWLIKTRMQLQRDTRLYRNSWDCLRKVLRDEGLRGLYRGLSASYLGVAEGTIQWVLYERIKHHLQGSREDPHAPDTKADMAKYFLAAAGSKLFAATLTYPHEVLRTRLREHNHKYHGLLHALRAIARDEGMAALYGGMTAHMMRVVPNSAIMFFCYELITHLYHQNR